MRARLPLRRFVAPSLRRSPPSHLFRDHVQRPLLHFLVDAGDVFAQDADADKLHAAEDRTQMTRVVDSGAELPAVDEEGDELLDGPLEGEPDTMNPARNNGQRLELSLTSPQGIGIRRPGLVGPPGAQIGAYCPCLGNTPRQPRKNLPPEIFKLQHSRP